MRHFIFFWRNNEVLGLVTSIILLIMFLFLWWKNTDICTLCLLSLLLNWLMQCLHFRLAHCWYDRKAAEKTKHHAVYNISNMFLYNISQIMNVLWPLQFRRSPCSQICSDLNSMVQQSSSPSESSSPADCQQSRWVIIHEKKHTEFFFVKQYWCMQAAVLSNSSKTTSKCLQ